MTYFHFLILALLDLSIGIFIFLKNPKKQTHIAFGIVSLVLAGWIISLFCLLKANHHASALFWGRTTFTVGMLGPAAILHFILAFPNDRLSIPKISLVYFAGLLSFVLSLTSWVIRDVKLEPSLTPVTGPLYLVIVTYFIFYFFLNIFYLYKKLVGSVGVKKLQVLYIFMGFVLFLGHIILTNLILPLLNFKNIFALGPWATLELEALFGYAILRYRMLEIEIVIKRTTLYLGLLIFITGVYSFIVMLPQRLAGQSGSVGSVSLMILSAVIIAVTLQPIRNWLDKITDNVFFQKKYNYFQLLEKISRELSTVVRLEDMLNMVSSSLLAAMHLDKIGVFVLARGDRGMEFQCLKKIGEKAGEVPERIEEDNSILNFLASYKKPLVSGEFRHIYGHLYAGGKIVDEGKAEVQRNLDEVMHAGVVLPLWLKTNLAGFMILGEKKSGDQFTDRDLSFLETISNQMSVVLENTRLYDQMLANERLAILGTMSASIAHEIRNPLASIKTFVQMLPNKYQQTEFRLRFDEIVPHELDRMTRITEDLLIFARPSPPAFIPTELNLVVDRVVTLMANQGRKRDVSMETNYGALPAVQSDGQQLTQVFMNLILNAIQASEPGKKIYVQSVLCTKPDPFHPDPYVRISIRDEGPGIPAKDFHNIFQPFFTTKHEGTGLGLPTSKRIVEAHHGELVLESQVGVGTTFTVILPVNQPKNEMVSL